MDQTLLDILACPLCKGKLVLHSNKQELMCRFDKLAYPIRSGIPVMLADEARRLEAEEGL
ncbi:MAG: hypothetical protein A3F10_05960 [Coxiella sp. RIFCSPHIGHO2_12_FULL_42_15]|nr:MAG: hypothetical protein A3F10_05960 [Coxiella sp. RIFCSPHIGHO2_12_FULL_42_15]